MSSLLTTLSPALRTMPLIEQALKKRIPTYSGEMEIQRGEATFPKWVEELGFGLRPVWFQELVL